jgi:hypothetical protein
MTRVEQEIMKKIISEEVRMKPGWWFRIKEAGIRTILVMLILGVGLTASTAVYVIAKMNLGELMQFGEIGREIIIEDFPYLMVTGVILMGIFGVMLSGKVGNNYRVETKRLGLVVGLIYLGLTAAMTVLRLQ